MHISRSLVAFPRLDPGVSSGGAVVGSMGHVTRVDYTTGSSSGGSYRQSQGLGKPETLYHRDDALLYIAYVMLIWAAPIPADR